MIKYILKIKRRRPLRLSGDFLELQINDIVVMKKPHPCGCREFQILRLGVDYRLKCLGCGREVMVPRIKALKSIKKKKEEQP